MPIRWTAELDQLLLVKILETHNVPLKYDVLAAAWPGSDRPTPKALSEHISKIRKEVKKNLDANGLPTTTIAKKGAARAKPINNLLKSTKAAKGTKRAKDDDEEDEIPKKRVATKATVNKKEHSSESEDEEVTPRRTAAMSANKTMKQKHENDDSDDNGPMRFDIEDTTSNEYQDSDELMQTSFSSHFMPINGAGVI